MDDWKKFWSGVAQGATWDIIKSLFRIIYWVTPLLLSGRFIIGSWDFLGLVPMVGSILAFLGYGFMVFGVFATLWTVAGRISQSSDILESDKPNLVQDNEWNQIIDYEGKKIAIGMISIKNRPNRQTSIKNRPNRQTDNSTAFEVSARLEYYDRANRKIAQVKCGYWTRDSAQNYFLAMGKKKRCEKINFYTHDTWYLPIAYQVENNELIYAYDHASAVQSKKIGNLPIKVSIVFEAENLKTTQPIRYLLIPNTTGIYPRGFWIQKK